MNDSDMIVNDASGSIDNEDVETLRLKLIEAEDTFNSLELQLDEAKKHRTRLQIELLPAAMSAARKKKIEYADGSVLSLREFLEASIPSASAIKDSAPEEQEEMVGRKIQALAWLRDNQGNPIIKNQLVIDLPKGKDNVVARITALCDELELLWVRSEAVNPMTLKSFLKEKLKAGVNIPVEIFKLVTGNKAILKRGK